MTVTRTLRRPRILIVGCGDVGLRCVERLRGRSRVFALTSQASRVSSLRAAGTVPLVGDLDARRSLARLAGLAPTVLHLAPPPKTGSDDRRTQALIAALTARRRSPARSASGSSTAGGFGGFGGVGVAHGSAPTSPTAPISLPRRLRRTAAAGSPESLRASRRGRLRLPGKPTSPSSGRSAIVPDRGFATGRRRSRMRLVYASTTGVYGDCGGARIDETRTPSPTTPRAVRRVAAERRLRRATAGGALAATIARIPGIYAADRLPLARLEKRTPALVDADDVYTSHIHADDLAAILVRLATHGRAARVIHASDDSEMKMGAYFDRVADVFGLARAPRVSRADAERQLDPLLLSFMRESRRLSNRRLKRELGVRLRYPSVDAFLRTLPPRA
ncbi:MAG TPA: NAD-dependent epimerase/dehydratase family protein [Paraburkholderia sp.]|jgi:nucleoside-diphosphate-sugar epimerase|nr:NAD-dependent epimerase/dehydratase family protein [Paraburkholderia sp.]